MTMMAKMAPGYDGETFSFERIRDHAGRGKRELVRRIRYDVVENLYRRELIDLNQRDAAVRLQADDQLAKTPATARVGSLGTGGHDFGVADAILAATGRVRRAKAFVGLQWPIVECVVICNLNLSRTAKAFGLEQARVLPRLRGALDSLDDFYAVNP